MFVSHVHATLLTMIALRHLISNTLSLFMVELQTYVHYLTKNETYSYGQKFGYDFIFNFSHQIRVLE